MPKTVERLKCEECSETYRTVGAAEACERDHKIDDLISRISEATNEHEKTIRARVIEYLELSLEHSLEHFGTKECPQCETMVHETWEECPECRNRLLDPYTGGTLKCGNCDSISVKVMRKDGVTGGVGVRCMDCDEFVAHFNGVFNTRITEGYFEENND